MKKRALVTGITGQDGAYLTRLLTDKGYQVHGIRRPSSTSNLERLKDLLEDPSRDIVLHYGDLTDFSSITRIISESQPHEIYNLAAQSNVALSFESPEYTANVAALGALRILEALRILNLTATTRYYQASTSELFGKVQEVPQKETTPFYPRSPYGVAKLYAYWMTVNYREAYGLFAANGILFNHESPFRGETFVTKKVTLALTRIVCGLQKELRLGNLEAKRDWGHARDFVEMQWMILQQPTPDDYVIATGKQYRVRDFVEAASRELGLELEWHGEGVNEWGVIASIDKDRMPNGAAALEPGQTIVRVDPQFFRPAEVDTLLGDANKAYRKLGWTSKTSLDDLVKEMVSHDLKQALSERLLATADLEEFVPIST